MTTMCVGVPNCNGTGRGGCGSGGCGPLLNGTGACDQPAVVFRSFFRFTLICLPLAICAARLHSRGAGSPAMVTQDVNRCLAVARVAASRRGAAGRGRESQEQRTRHATNGPVVPYPAYPPPSVCDIPV